MSSPAETSRDEDPMPGQHAVPSSWEDSSSESEIEGCSVPQIRLTETALGVYTLLRGLPTGDLGLLNDAFSHHLRQGSDETNGTLAPMPDRHFHQTLLPNQATPTCPKFEPSVIGKSKSEVFEYFGFIQIKNKWIDPDSTTAVDKASKGNPDVTDPLLPGMDSSSAPYILSNSEQSLMYAELMEDPNDVEGDPRDFRISPETFAKWAEGAVKVKPLVHEVVEQSIQNRRVTLHRSKRPAKLTLFVPQYCAMTGVSLSPAYSVDEDPSLLLSPQSHDMNHLPMMFSRSYPLADLQFKRHHYFDAHVADSMPAPSSTEHITSDCVREALAVDWDPESGDRQVKELRDYIDQLQAGCEVAAQEISAAGKISNELEKEVDQLRGITQLLRKRVAIAEELKVDRQHRRIKEHLGTYVETLTHKLARMNFSAQKARRKNDYLLEERNRYTVERQDLQDTITALYETSELDCTYETTDEEE